MKVHEHLSHHGFERQSTGTYSKPLENRFALRVKHKRDGDLLALYLVYLPDNTLIQSAFLCTDDAELPSKLSRHLFAMSSRCSETCDPASSLTCPHCGSRITTKVYRNRAGKSAVIHGCIKHGCGGTVQLRKLRLN